MEKQELQRLIYEDFFIGDLLTDKQANVLIEKHLLTFVREENYLKWVTLKQLVSFPEITISKEKAARLIGELAEIKTLHSLTEKVRKRIPLWGLHNLEDFGFNAGCPSIQLYLLDREGEGPFPVMIVAAGGAYGMRAGHEAYPVALWLNSIGISAIVLNYRVAPYKHPIPISDAKRAIRMARFYAKEWKLDRNRVGIIGFSAGGHLASTSGTHFDLGIQKSEDPIERYSSRPDLMVLCYPVITMGEHTHEGSRLNLLGENQSPEILTLLSNESQITKDTPPAFLWHTADDAAVDVENSLLFAAQLSRNHIPYDLHIFESGQHGLGLAENHPEAKSWPRLCEAWLRRRGF